MMIGKTVLLIAKYLLSLYVIGRWHTYFSESVSLNPGRKSGKFQCNGKAIHLLPCIGMHSNLLAPYPIRVWSSCLSLHGYSRTLLPDKRVDSALSFYMNMPYTESMAPNISNDEKKMFSAYGYGLAACSVRQRRAQG